MKLRLGKVIIWFWKLRGQNVDYLQKQDLAERFCSIYADNVWTGRRIGESASGHGSTTEATQQLAAELPKLLNALGAESLLDLGCGQYHWMRNANLNLDYIGVDIVPSVIEANRNLYQDDKHHFVVLNGCTEPLPSADAILCRGVMFHLSFRDATNLLRNVKRSAAKHFICTTDPTTLVNADIPSGAWRDINLERRPYLLGPPLAIIKDTVPDNPSRVLGLWLVGSLPF